MFNIYLDFVFKVEEMNMYMYVLKK